jgi:hypothetical protein
VRSALDWKSEDTQMDQNDGQHEQTDQPSAAERTKRQTGPKTPSAPCRKAARRTSTTRAQAS